MVWSRETSCGRETSKTRERLLPYLCGKGVDLGCGTDKLNSSALGVDRYPYHEVDFLSDVTKLDYFENNFFDYVYSSHTLEDIDDTKKTLKEWWRILRPGGFLILYLPHRSHYPNIGTPGSNPAHKHDFIPYDIIRIMPEVGRYKIVHKATYSEGNEYSFLLIIKKLGKERNKNV